MGNFSLQEMALQSKVIPAEAVAWLANTLGRYDIPLLKDEIILSGSLVPLEPAIPGDKFEMKINGLGSCKVEFKE